MHSAIRVFTHGTRSRNRSWTLLTLSLAALTSPARSAVIVDTFDTGQSYLSTSFQVGQSSEIAIPFSLGAAYNLTQIDIALWFRPTATSTVNAFTVEITSDNSGQPGTVLASWALNNVSTNPHSSLNTLTFSPLTLSAGVQYWILGLAPDPLTDGGWNISPVTIGSLAGSSNSGGNWTIVTNNVTAFDLVGSPLSLNGDGAAPTPEPVSEAPMGLGLVGLALLRRHRETVG